jgi:hypothetical protein
MNASTPTPQGKKRKRRHHRHVGSAGPVYGNTWVVALVLALIATGVTVGILYYGPQILKWLAWPFGE